MAKKTQPSKPSLTSPPPFPEPSKTLVSLISDLPPATSLPPSPEPSTPPKPPPPPDPPPLLRVPENSNLDLLETLSCRDLVLKPSSFAHAEAAHSAISVFTVPFSSTSAQTTTSCYLGLILYPPLSLVKTHSIRSVLFCLTVSERCRLVGTDFWIDYSHCLMVLYDHNDCDLLLPCIEVYTSFSLVYVVAMGLFLNLSNPYPFKSSLEWFSFPICNIAGSIKVSQFSDIPYAGQGTFCCMEYLYVVLSLSIGLVFSAVRFWITLPPRQITSAPLETPSPIVSTCLVEAPCVTSSLACGLDWCVMDSWRIAFAARISLTWLRVVGTCSGNAYLISAGCGNARCQNCLKCSYSSWIPRLSCLLGFAFSCHSSPQWEVGNELKNLLLDISCLIAAFSFICIFHIPCSIIVSFNSSVGGG